MDMLNVVVVSIGAVFFSFCFRISLIRTYAATFNEICLICVICGHKSNNVHVFFGIEIENKKNLCSASRSNDHLLPIRMVFSLFSIPQGYFCKAEVRHY